MFAFSAASPGPCDTGCSPYLPPTVTILLERKRLSLRVDMAFKLPTLLGKGGAKLSATHFTHLAASLFPLSGSCPKFQASHRHSHRRRRRHRYNTRSIAAAEHGGHLVLVWRLRAELSARSSWCRDLSSFYHH